MSSVKFPKDCTNRIHHKRPQRFSLTTRQQYSNLTWLNDLNRTIEPFGVRVNGWVGPGVGVMVAGVKGGGGGGEG